jgi:hypothetical protein
MDLESVESKPSVQESIGIFQLIDKLETAVDKLLERQVYVACTVQVGMIKTDFLYNTVPNAVHCLQIYKSGKQYCLC